MFMIYLKSNHGYDHIEVHIQSINITYHLYRYL